MKKNFSSKKSAFSLIELSIVLIIIGLLIAGITGGASLIKSSEMRSVMGEARGYSVAVNAFFTQFDALPGDISIATGSVNNITGNANGQIQYGTGEGVDAWFDLRNTGAIDNTLTYLAISGAQAPGTNIPGSKVKSAGWAFDYNSTTTFNVVVLTGTTVAADATNTLVNGTIKSSVAITTADAASIDSKADNGIANSGNIQGINVTGTDCFNGAVYSVANSGKRCPLQYRVDISS